MNKFNEKSLVEDHIIEKLQEAGWKFIPAESLERESLDEPLIISTLVKTLNRINADKGITDEEINKVLNMLKFTGTGVEGSKTILNYYKFGVPVKFEHDRILHRVQLFDYACHENNECTISRQVYFHGRDFIRTDIILYINGIPLINIECKSPVSVTESWADAYRQILKYCSTVPELYKYVQIGIAAESIARYFPIVLWKEDVNTYEWHNNCPSEPGTANDSVASLMKILKGETLLDIIKNFLFFRSEREEANKIIARYMQYRAVNKIVKRVTDTISGNESKKRGFVWHWQGSGKTFTMIFAANKLYYNKKLSNPSIFFIVDRNELERQLNDEFNYLDIIEPEKINSVFELRRILRHDDYRGKRGIFITLIHKFRQEDLSELQKKIEEISLSKETISNRENVIVFIDEGHRTQYGVLAAQMKKIFKNAFFFAFTGTPISKKGKDTYLEFSYPPEEIYLDRYFIADSIKDEYTVKIVYQPRLAENVHLKKEMLESFLESEFEEIPEEEDFPYNFKEKIKERIRERLNPINLFLEKPERIDSIAQDIAVHFKENIDGKYKAVIVAASRKACAIYKKMIDKYLPDNYSEIVMTHTNREKGELLERVAEVAERFGTRDIDDINEQNVLAFKEKADPSILIVTDMLLTGFDAPQLQVMYLDKPLKEHRLLQAIARTNRPYKNIKDCGLIIDYVGILGNIKKALEIYNEDDIEHALFNFEKIRSQFKELIKEILDIFPGFAEKFDRQTLLKTFEILTSDTINEKNFNEKYRKLRKLFEILGADEIKLNFLNQYRWINAVFIYYDRMVNKSSAMDGLVEKYFTKTVKFIHQSTEVKDINNNMPFIDFDENYLNNLHERLKDKKEQAANILFTLNRFVLVDKNKNPAYESLVQKVERLLQLWSEKTKNYDRIYSEGIKVVSLISDVSKRQKALELDDIEYPIFLIIEDNFIRSNKEFSQKELLAGIKELNKNLQSFLFPGWYNQVTEVKKAERQVRKFMRNLKVNYGFSIVEMDKFFYKIMEQIKYHEHHTY